MEFLSGLIIPFYPHSVMTSVFQDLKEKKRFKGSTLNVSLPS